MGKSLHSPFPKKDSLRIFKNNRGIIFTTIVVKVYHTMLLTDIQSEIEKILWKNLDGFWRNQSTTLQILTLEWIIKRVNTKYLMVTLLFVNFSKSFYSIHRGKMEQILQIAYSLHKENVTGVMMLYKNTKVMVHSPDGDTGCFDIIAGIL